MKLRLLTRELVCVSNHARGDIPGFYDCLVQAVVGGYDRCLVMVLFEHSDSSLDTLMKGGGGASHALIVAFGREWERELKISWNTGFL